MNRWTKIKIALYRLGFLIRTKSRYYQYWSHLYRFLFNPKSKREPLTVYTDYVSLADTLDTLVWKADGLKELWDACADPEFVEYIVRHSDHGAIGDCDEFAIYITSCLNKAIKQGDFSDKTLELVAFTTVVWVDKDGVAGGHNVGLLMGTDPETGNSRLAFMDYGMPSTPRATIKEVVEDVMREYAPGGVCCGYAVQAEDLTPFIVESGVDVAST